VQEEKEEKDKQEDSGLGVGLELGGLEPGVVYVDIGDDVVPPPPTLSRAPSQLRPTPHVVQRPYEAFFTALVRMGFAEDDADRVLSVECESIEVAVERILNGFQPPAINNNNNNNNNNNSNNSNSDVRGLDSDDEEESRSIIGAIPPNHWPCPMCTYHNSNASRACEICATDNPQPPLDIVIDDLDANGNRPASPLPPQDMDDILDHAFGGPGRLRPIRPIRVNNPNPNPNRIIRINNPNNPNLNVVLNRRGPPTPAPSMPRPQVVHVSAPEDVCMVCYEPLKLVDQKPNKDKDQAEKKEDKEKEKEEKQEAEEENKETEAAEGEKEKDESKEEKKEEKAEEKEKEDEEEACVVKSVCRHNCCNDCWEAYLMDRINDGRVAKIECPDVGCKRPLTEQEITSRIPEDGVAKYEKFAEAARLALDPNARWCPTPNRETVMFGSNGKPRLKCPKCAFELCFKCSEPWHGRRSCEKNGEDVMSAYKRQNNVKLCPSCRVPTERSEGCNHMTCSRCRHEWCWMCRGKYSSIHYNPFNIFGCPGLQDGGLTWLGDDSCFGVNCGCGCGVLGFFKRILFRLLLLALVPPLVVVAFFLCAVPYGLCCVCVPAIWQCFTNCCCPPAHVRARRR